MSLRSLTLWILLAAAMLTVMAGALVGPIVTIMMEPLGATPETIGLVVTMHSLPVVVLSPAFGCLNDRIGRKPVFVFALLLYGLAGGSGYFITHLVAMLISRVLLGVAIAALGTTITTIIADIYKGPARDAVMGYRSSANSAGGIILPLIGGFLGTITWNTPFLAYFVGLPLGLIVWLTLPESKEIGMALSSTSPRPTRGESPQLHTSLPPDWKETPKREVPSLRSLIRSTPLLLLNYAFIFLSMAHFYTIVIFYPQLLGSLGITNSFTIAILFLPASLIGTATSLAYSRLRRRLPYRTLALSAFACWVVAFSLLSFTHHLPLWELGLAALGLGQGLALPTANAWVAHLTPPQIRGRAISGLYSSAYLGQFLSTFLYGPFLSPVGFQGLFTAVTVVNLTTLLLLLIYSRLKSGETAG